MKINWSNLIAVVAIVGLWVIIAHALGLEQWLVYLGSGLLGLITARPLPITKRY